MKKTVAASLEPSIDISPHVEGFLIDIGTIPRMSILKLWVSMMLATAPAAVKSVPPTFTGDFRWPGSGRIAASPACYGLERGVVPAPHVRDHCANGDDQDVDQAVLVLRGITQILEG
jgi:hypothetical protein